MDSYYLNFGRLEVLQRYVNLLICRNSFIGLKWFVWQFYCSKKGIKVVLSLIPLFGISLVTDCLS